MERSLGVFSGLWILEYSITVFKALLYTRLLEDKLMQRFINILISLGKHTINIKFSRIK